VGAMYQEKIILTPQDILEKEFKVDTRGYRLKEVDKFLDLIIRDYEQFIDIIHQTEDEKKELMEENLKLKQEIRNMKMNMDIVRQGEKEVTNVDILRRLSHLEKIFYGKE
jgi:DivIVA domain-containing protein